MTILFLIVVAACWVLGIADGDCTAALMFTMFGALAAIDEIRERRRAKKLEQKKKMQILQS